MDISVPFSVATASDLGCIAALTSRDDAKAIILGYFKRQTEAHFSRGINSAECRFVRNPDELFMDLEQSIVKEGLSVFGYECIEARRELDLPPSVVFPRPDFPLPTHLDTQSQVWFALEAANEPKETELVLGVYVDGKLKKGRTAGEISSKLDSIEAKLMESKVHRHSDAFIAFRLERSLPPSKILDSPTFSPTRFAASARSKGQLSMPVSFSTSTDPTVNAQAAFQFLSRRAVDGYVESQKAVVSALEDSRTRREEGRALLLLQGFCYHNSRKEYSVEERLDRLEKELLARRLLNFSAEIYETRHLLSLPPSQLFPFTPAPQPTTLPPPPPSSSVASPIPASATGLSSLPPVVREPSTKDEFGLPAYVNVG